MSYTIGEKPGRGTYACVACRWWVHLSDEAEALPPCRRCGHMHATRYLLAARAFADYRRQRPRLSNAHESETC